MTIDFTNFSVDAGDADIEDPLSAAGDFMRTLFLNPPSFEGFDGGASSRWPASREIESYWYPVWLCYPAGMLPDSKVVDAPPHKISIEQTVEMAKDFELLVLFTSTPGFHVDVKIAEMMKDVEPEAEGGLRRPAGHDRAGEDAAERHQGHRFRRAARVRLSDRRLRQGQAARRTARASASARTARSSTIRKAPVIENLDELPWVTKVYKRDLDVTRYNVPFLLNPFISFYTSRGCPAHVHVLPVAADAFRPSLAAALVRRRGQRSAATRSSSSRR